MKKIIVVLIILGLTLPVFADYNFGKKREPAEEKTTRKKPKKIENDKEELSDDNTEKNNEEYINQPKDRLHKLTSEEFLQYLDGRLIEIQSYFKSLDQVNNAGSIHNIMVFRAFLKDKGNKDFILSISPRDRADFVAIIDLIENQINANLELKKRVLILAKMARKNIEGEEYTPPKDNPVETEKNIQPTILKPTILGQLSSVSIEFNLGLFKYNKKSPKIIIGDKLSVYRKEKLIGHCTISRIEDDLVQVTFDKDVVKSETNVEEGDLIALDKN